MKPQLPGEAPSSPARSGTWVSTGGPGAPNGHPGRCFSGARRLRRALAIDDGRARRYESCCFCGTNSVGRVPASQAGCRRFEPGVPLPVSCSRGEICRVRRGSCAAPLELPQAAARVCCAERVLAAGSRCGVALGLAMFRSGTNLGSRVHAFFRHATAVHLLEAGVDLWAASSGAGSTRQRRHDVTVRRDQHANEGGCPEALRAAARRERSPARPHPALRQDAARLA